MGTSRRTLLTLLATILPAAGLTAVGAEASTHTHAHHAMKTASAKSAHKANHKTAALHSHSKTHAAG